MVRMGPRMTPTMGPIVGPNPAIGGDDPLVGYSATFTTSFADSQLYLLSPPAEGLLVDGVGPFRLTSDGALPTGLLAATDYYGVADAYDTLRLCLTQADAIAHTNVVSFDDDGTGTHTITYVG